MSYIENFSGKGLFKDPKYKKYGDMVSFKDIPTAMKSITDLQLEFYDSKQQDKKLTIARVMQYSANRCLASTKNPKLTTKERKELTAVGNEYKEASQDLWNEYRKLYK